MGREWWKLKRLGGEEVLFFCFCFLFVRREEDLLKIFSMLIMMSSRLPSLLTFFFFEAIFDEFFFCYWCLERSVL